VVTYWNVEEKEPQRTRLETQSRGLMSRARLRSLISWHFQATLAGDPIRPLDPSASLTALTPTTSNNLLSGLSTPCTSLLRPSGKCRQWENGFKLEFPCRCLRNARPSRRYNGKGSRGGDSAFTWYCDPRSPLCRSY
jgi:hypothetical protein